MLKSFLAVPAFQLLAGIGCLSLAVSVGKNEVVSAMAVYGGDSSSASCNDDCQEDVLRVDECYHDSGEEEEADDCLANKCLRNLIAKVFCTEYGEGTYCSWTEPTGWTEEGGYEDWAWFVRQEERASANCQTTGNEWHFNTPGECEWMYTYPDDPNLWQTGGEGIGTRCQTGHSCDGMLIDSRDFFGEIPRCDAT